MAKLRRKSTNKPAKKVKKGDVYKYEDSHIKNKKNRAGPSVDSDSDDDRIKDDESIDDEGSEIGWNSEDEAAYGHIFNRNKGGQSPVDSEEDEEDDVEGGEMLLSDMLGASTSKTKPVSDTPDDEEERGDSDEENDNDDDSSDEENGSYDDGNVDGLDTDTDDSDDYDTNDEDEGNHSKLLAAIERFSKASEDSAHSSEALRKGSQSAKESEYSALLDAVNTSSSVSLDTLLGALDDTGDVKTLKQRLSTLEKTAAPKHTHKVHSDRLERGITYKNTSEDMSKWQKSVMDNKHAVSLDLAQDKRQLPSYRTLVKKFEPVTDMEKEISMVLLKNGQGSEEQIAQQEGDELGERELSAEELKERQAALAKVKALLFYEQMKRHRINKIKSKAYHRILKRKKARKQENDEDYAKLVEMAKGEEGSGDEEEVKRIKERMNLRHKNTGKWARMAVKHGHTSKSLREAYHESVLLGQELKRKANDAAEASDDNRDDWSDEEGTSSRSRLSKKTAVAFGDALDDKSEPDVDGKYRGLFEMDFMKRAREQRKEKAQEEAKNILREIETMEDSIGDDSDDEGPKQKKIRSAEDEAKLAAARKEMEILMSKGSGGSMNLVSSGKHDDSENEDGDDGANPWLDTKVTGRSADAIIGTGLGKKKTSVLKDNKEAGGLLTGAVSGWVTSVDDGMPSSASSATVRSEKTSKSKKGTNGIVNAKTTQTTSSTSALMGTNDKLDVPNKTTSGSSKHSRKPLLMQKSQETLVQEAFAGPDYEEEFNALKEKAVDEELNIVDKKRKILSEDKAGWGAWAGPGQTGISQRVVQKRKRLLKSLEEKNAEMRAGRKDGTLANVMLSEKRVKTSAKYKIADIPHPFKTREEYERSIQMPMGDEWNAAHVVRKNTKPEIMLRAGRIIEPIKLAKQHKDSSKAK